MGSRKLFAVKQSDMKYSKRRSAANIINISSSDSDDELVIPLVRHQRSAEAAKLAVISNDVKQMKESVSNIFKLTTNMAIPLGLRQLLHDTFKCSICQSTPMVPPGIFAKCCRSVLGCHECVDTWRTRPNEDRPKCREVTVLMSRRVS